MTQETKELNPAGWYVKYIVPVREAISYAQARVAEMMESENAPDDLCGVVIGIVYDLEEIEILRCRQLS